VANAFSCIHRLLDHTNEGWWQTDAVLRCRHCGLSETDGQVFLEVDVCKKFLNVKAQHLNEQIYQIVCIDTISITIIIMT
jgi:hypothetical protein